jgi:hypothetical protein
MKDLEVEGIRLRCRNYKQFPPANMSEIVIQEWGSLEQQRLSGKISEAIYERTKVWIKVCGLYQMGNKCFDCPHCTSVKKNELRVEVMNNIDEQEKLILQKQKV